MAESLATGCGVDERWVTSDWANETQGFVRSLYMTSDLALHCNQSRLSRIHPPNAETRLSLLLPESCANVHNMAMQSTNGITLQLVPLPLTFKRLLLFFGAPRRSPAEVLPRQPPFLGPPEIDLPD